MSSTDLALELACWGIAIGIISILLLLVGLGEYYDKHYETVKYNEKTKQVEYSNPFVLASGMFFCFLIWAIIVYTMLTGGFSGKPSSMPWG
jgi:hypothetical protein